MHIYIVIHNWASVVAQKVKNLLAVQEIQVWSLGQEDPLEYKLATHSSIFCLENTMNRGALQLTVHGAQTGEQNWVTKTFTFTYTQLVVVAVQLSHVRLFVAPLFDSLLCLSLSLRLLKFMCTESVMPSNHIIVCHPFSCCPQSFPASVIFPMSWLFPSGVQTFGVSASASVLLMNIQGWFSLGSTGFISLYFFHIYLPSSDATRCHDLCFLNVEFKPAFSLSSFTLITSPHFTLFFHLN